MDRYGHLFKSDDHKVAMEEIARQFARENPARSIVSGRSAPRPAQQARP